MRTFHSSEMKSIRISSGFLLTLALGLNLQCTALGQSVPVTIEAHRDSIVPGKPDFDRFSLFDLPVVNGSGQVAFVASYFNQNQGGSSLDAIWTIDENGNPRMLVSEGEEARAVSETTFFQGHPAFNIAPVDPGRPASVLINDTGEIAFNFNLEDAGSPGELLTSAWVMHPDETLSPVVYKGMPIPDSEETFAGISSDWVNMGYIPRLYLNSFGQLAFNSSFNQIWLETPRCGETYHIDPLEYARTQNNDMEYFLTDDGALLIWDPDEEAILYTDKNGSKVLIERGTALPGMNLLEESVSRIREVRFNRNGSIALSCQSRYANEFGNTVNGSHYLYVYHLSGAARIVKKVPSNYEYFIEPAFLQDNGRLVHVERAFIYSAIRTRKVFIEDSIIIEADIQGPESGDGQTIIDLWVTGANNRDQVVFKADLRNLGGEAAYAWDGTKLVKIIQTGDVVETAPGEERTITSVFFNTFFHANSKRNISETGKVVMKAGGGILGELILSAELGQNTELRNVCGLKPRDTAANYNASEVAAGSINAYTGEFLISPTQDLVLGGGPKPLFFSRFYASGLSLDPNNPMGNNWSHNFEMSLTRSPNAVRIVSNTGRIIRFKKAGDEWQLSSPLDRPHLLLEADNTFIFFDHDSRHQFVFDSADCRRWRLSEILDRHNNALQLSYNDADQLSEVTDGLGRTLTFFYESGHLVKVSDGTREVSFSYDGNNNLVRFTDAESQNYDYQYEDSRAACGLWTATRYPGGITPSSMEYDDQARVVKLKDAEDNFYAYSYNENLTTVAFPTGGGNPATSQQFAHNNQGQLVAFTDENKNTAHFSYDSKGRLETVSDNQDPPRTTQYAYHEPSGHFSSTTVLFENVRTEFTYTKRTSNGIDYYDLSEILYPDKTKESFVNDNAGNLIQWTDQNGNAWDYSHNDRGQVLTADNPEGGRTRYAYNDNGSLATITDHSNNAIRFSYDSLGRIQTITYPDDSTRIFSYNKRDEVINYKDGEGNSLSLQIDERGNIEEVILPTSNKIHYDFDEIDSVRIVTDPLNNTTEIKRDRQGRPRELKAEQDGATVLEYDALGRLETVTDGLGNQWKTAYDNENEITAITDPLNYTTEFSQDHRGRVSTVTTPLGNQIKVSYNLLDRIEHLENPMGKKAHISYNNRGQVSGYQLPEDFAVGYQRDKLGQITKITDPNGGEWLRDYDPQGRLLSTTDPLGNHTTYAYDNRNRVSGITFPDLSSLNVEYDRRGNVKRSRYSGPPDIVSSKGGDPGKAYTIQDNHEVIIVDNAFEYDSAGYLVEAREVSMNVNDMGNIVECNGLKMDYIAGHRGYRIKKINYGKDENGKELDLIYTYDQKTGSQLQSITDWNGLVTRFTYHLDGTIASIERPNNTRTFYNYDRDRRITRVYDRAINYSSGLLEESRVDVRYNKNGKAIEVTETGIYGFQFKPDKPRNLNTRYEKGHQVLGLPHDVFRRPLADEFRSYEWYGFTNMLTAYKPLEGNPFGIIFSYDGLGMLNNRFAGGFYKYSTNEYDTSGVTNDNYVWNYAFKDPRIAIVRGPAGLGEEQGPDFTYYIYTPSGQLLYYIEAGDNKAHFYHWDMFGNVRFITSEEGKPEVAYGYDPSGGQTVHVMQSTRFPEPPINPFTFKGMFGWMREEPTSSSVKDYPIYYALDSFYDSYRRGHFVYMTMEEALNRSLLNQFDPRVEGAIRFVGGAVEVTIGIAGAPETGGVSLLLVPLGIDEMIVGGRMMYDNERHDSLLDAAIGTGPAMGVHLVAGLGTSFIRAPALVIPRLSRGLSAGRISIVPARTAQVAQKAARIRALRTPPPASMLPNSPPPLPNYVWQPPTNPVQLVPSPFWGPNVVPHTIARASPTSNPYHYNSLMEQLLRTGSRQGKRIHDKIAAGDLEIRLVDIDPWGRTGVGGFNPFQSNELYLVMSEMRDVRQAAGILGHEGKHAIDNFPEAAYSMRHEVEAFMYQRAIDPTFPLRSDVDIWSFVRTGTHYKMLKPIPVGPGTPKAW